MKKYNPELPTLIFDLDGTIVDNFHENWNIIYNKHIKMINKQIGDVDDFYELLRDNNLKDLLSKYKINPISFLFDKVILKSKFISSAKSAKMFPKMIDFLREENDNFNFVLISSAYKEYIDIIFERFDLEKRFVDKVNCGLFNKSRKIFNILKKYDIDREKCIYVGDEVRDYLACEKIGLKCISVSYGFNSKKLLQKYNNYLCDDVEELKTNIETILG